LITRGDIEAAASRTRDWLRRTPVLVMERRSFGHDGPLFLKLELHQHTGSFKPRGAFNRILSSDVPDAGVIAASGGNHGVAVAYACRELGVPAEVFVPQTSAPVKIDRLRGYGAKVVLVGRHYAEALEASQARAGETGALVVHAYDDPEVQAGQGTVARELASQIPDVDTVLVAVGGGGLVAGIASWFADQARVVAVEPEGIPTLARALEAQRPVDVEVSGIAVDSLGARRISDGALDAARRHAVRSVLVSDKHIAAARLRLWEEVRIVAEVGGATAVAALTSGAYHSQPDERIAVIVCGGNTDPSDLVP
jgi:threonine dehydratase